MVRFPNLSTHSVVGRVVRLPFRLIPKTATLRVLQGPMKGMKWIAGSFNHRCWLGDYEVEKQIAVCEHVKAGQVFFDIGANVGLYTLLGSRLTGPTGRTVAFEPDPDNLTLLAKHIELNHLLNVEVVSAAVSNNTGTAAFASGPTSSMGRLAGDGGLIVKTIAIDDFARNTALYPDALKIDVEGGELAVLQGAIQTLRERHPHIFLATHGEYQETACLSLLKSLGYRVRAIARDEYVCD